MKKKKQEKVNEGICDFFQSMSLKEASSALHEMIKCSQSKKQWKGGRKDGSPSDLLYFTEILIRLTSNVYKLVSQGVQKPEVILKPSPWYVPDIDHKKNYCRSSDAEMAWDFFPRHLSVKEYHNPYYALIKFTNELRKKEWLFLYSEIQYYALSRHSMGETSVDYKLYQVGGRLMKLLEACHLIVIRSAKKKFR